MSKFENAIDFVLLHEGGFIDHPDDPGGATNFGVSMRWLKQQGDLDGDGWLDGDLDHDGDVDIDDILAMTRDAAIGFYRTLFWEPNRYEHIRSQLIATKALDFTVNMGARQSHKLLQRACRSCEVDVKDDGILGPKTIQAINSATDVLLLAALRSEAAGFYRLLAATKPARQKFLEGWLNRAYA